MQGMIRRFGVRRSVWSSGLIGIIGVAGLIVPCETAHADIAVTIQSGAQDNIFPNGGTTHGWQFFVNVPMEVTHLGLYDQFSNGFVIDHPIGLWDEDGNLLTSGMLSAGAGDPLIENFRYVDITDNEGGQGVTLVPGMMYTIGFYSEIPAQGDGMVIFDGFHEINPAVDYVGFGVSDFTDGLEMPRGDNDGTHRWGPNFQFAELTLCPWDLNGDGVVGVADLLALVQNFGPCDEDCPADFNGDGIVDASDLLTLIANFGECPGGGCPWDVNGDGVVDRNDAQAVIDNLGSCKDPDNCPWDVNGDGVVDGQDVAEVATHYGPCPK